MCVCSGVLCKRNRRRPSSLCDVKMVDVICNENNGSIVTSGAEFTRHAEVVFYPGNQRLSIIQTGRGLDEHNHLTVDTVVSGSVPFLPPGAEVTMDPFKEIYQYYPSGNHDNHKGQTVCSV